MRIDIKSTIILTAAFVLMGASGMGADPTKTTVSGKPEEILLPMVKFGNDIDTKGWRFNPWEGGNVSSTFERDDKFGEVMRLRWEKGATLSNPPLFQRLSEKWEKQYQTTGFYFRLKGDLSKGGLDIQYMMKNDTGDFMFRHNVPPMRIRDENGWQTERVPLGGEAINHPFAFKITELKEIHMTVYGEGRLELGEIGLIVKYSKLDATPSLPGKDLLAVPQKNTQVFIDGEINEDAWKSARRIELHPAAEKDIRKFCDSSLVPRERTEVFLLWDQPGLYVGAKCFKADMRQLKAAYLEDDNEIYNDECVELYLDPNKAGNLFPGMRKFAVNSNGKHGTLFTNSNRDGHCGVVTAARKFQDRWEMEFFIPWKALDTQPGHAAFLGFNVTRQTYGASQERSGWTTTKWDGISDFGALVLAASGAGEKPFPANIDLGVVAPGNYILCSALPRDGNLRYNMKLFKAGKLIAEKSGTSSGNPLCETFNVELATSQNYTLEAALYDSADSSAAFLQTEFADGPKTAAPALPIDAIALFPDPKELSLGSGVLKINDGTSFFLASKGLEFCGEKLSGELGRFYGVKLTGAENTADAVILLGLVDDLKDILKERSLEKDAEKIKHDGYLLSVTDNEIIAAAKEKRGVLYATEALISLIKMSSPETGPAQIRQLKVVDWPYFKNRPLELSMFGFLPGTKYDVTFYKQMLAQFPMSFRYNSFIFELNHYFLWPSVPSNKNPLAWNKAEFSEMVDFVNKNMCPVAPSVSSIGHQWEFFYQIDALRAMVHPGADYVGYTLCTRHPDMYKTLFSMYDDMIAICDKNKGCQTDYFHVGFDEVWFDKESKCPRCGAIPMNQRYLDHLRNIAAYLKTKNKRPVIWADMLVEEHNGLAASRISDIRGQLPKEVIVANWAGTLQDQAIPRFTKNSNEVWKIRTGYHISRLNDELANASGFLVCTYHWWLSFSRHLYSSSNYGLMAQALMANAAWNDFPDNDDSSWSEYCRVHGEFLMRNWSRKPLPGAGTGFKTIDISTVADESVIDKVAGDGKGWFDGGPLKDLSHMDFSVKAVEGIPVLFAEKGGVPSCVLLKAGATDPHEIKVGAKLGSLILLHAANLPPEKCAEFMKRDLYKDPAKGLELVSFKVAYADGSQAEFTVNYGWNVLHWLNSPEKSGAGCNLYGSPWATIPGVFAKYLPDARSFWEGSTAEALKRQCPADIAIYQFEWPNPYPEKPISSVTVTGKGVPHISYALLALTGRSVAEKQ